MHCAWPVLVTGVFLSPDQGELGAYQELELRCRRCGVEGFRETFDPATIWVDAYLMRWRLRQP